MVTVVDTTALPELPELPDGVFRPLRRTEFEAMVDQGLFDGTNVELVGGVLVEMSPQGSPHTTVVVRLTKMLVRAAGDDYEVGVQTPLAVDDISLPEPDFSVMRQGPTFEAHATRALLVVEVSRSSLPFDLGVKAARYAAAGYPEYWVVNVDRARVHVHTQPTSEGWGRVDVVSDAVLTSTTVPALSVDLPVLFAR